MGAVLWIVGGAILTLLVAIGIAVMAGVDLFQVLLVLVAAVMFGLFIFGFLRLLLRS